MDRENIKLLVIACAVKAEQILSLDLAQIEGFSIIGEAYQRKSAIEIVNRNQADVAIAIMNGSATQFLGLLKALGRKSDIPILVISSRDESIYAERSLRLGARGYVMVTASKKELIRAIRTVFHGDVYLSQKMHTRLLKEIVSADQ